MTTTQLTCTFVGYDADGKEIARDKQGVRNVEEFTYSTLYQDIATLIDNSKSIVSVAVEEPGMSTYAKRTWVYTPYDKAAEEAAKAKAKEDEREAKRLRMVSERVELGATFLDTLFGQTDWRDEINRETLDLGNGGTCILGQAAIMRQVASLHGEEPNYSDFLRYVVALGITTEANKRQWARERGFDSDDTKGITYGDLQVAWENELCSA